MAEREKTRVYSLDILKILGTILILFHHYQQRTNLYFAKGLNFYSGRILFGYVTELFFVLSGFFIFAYESKIREGLTFPAFWYKRAIRLLPLGALSVIVFDLLQEAYRNRFGAYYWGVKPTLFDSLITALGLQKGWFYMADSWINYPLWYISVLMLCYVLFWLYVKISSLCHIPAPVFYGVTIVLGVYGYLTGTNSPFLDMHACRGYYSFFTGVFLALILQKKPVGKAHLPISLLMIAGGLGGIAYFTFHGPENAFLPETFLLYPGLILLLLQPFFGKLFRHPFWGTWASLCFDVYIWHIPVFLGLCLADNYLGPVIQFHKLSGMLIFTLLAHLWGLFSYFCIEKKITPVLAALPHKLHRKAS